ncbi:hypothetical protein [Pseudomonas sp. MRSN 12121]|uniref:hypothetical protein n=1 Tax=Pseudomonas sp. MRSN 12121 TaxID=1611770 RepID=UPI00210A6915|nr:hypothetical protein [Pseudomonas sp. MRSN 12121]
MSWFNRIGWLRRERSPVPVAEPTKKTRLEDLADRLSEEVAVLPPGPSCPEAERIAASLRDFPGDWAWSHKGYELRHTPTGFTLWVANKDYGLAEVSSGHKAAFSDPEKAIIWPAVETWLSLHRLGFTGRLPKPRINFSGDTFWCRAPEHPWVGVGCSPELAYRSWARAVSIQARTDSAPGEILHVWSAAR